MRPGYGDPAAASGEQAPEAAQIEKPRLAGPIFDAVVVCHHVGTLVVGHRDAFGFVRDPAVGGDETGEQVVDGLLGLADEAVATACRSNFTSVLSSPRSPVRLSRSITM